jgi:hypothetical protein
LNGNRTSTLSLSSAGEGAFLNIFSMRSVIRKPPTTFVEEQVTAMNPKRVLKVL